MTAPTALHLVHPRPTALTFALAGLARLAHASGLFSTLPDEARRTLDAAHTLLAPQVPLLQQLRDALENPSPTDAALLAVTHRFDLTLLESLAIALTVAAEEDLVLGHILTALQQPLAHTRPTVGLLARAFSSDLPAHDGTRTAAVQLLAQGAASTCGLLQLLDSIGPLPERQVRVPLPLCLALSGISGPWPGAALLDATPPIPLGASALTHAATLGQRLAATLGSPAAPILLIRSPDPAESRAAAHAIAAACGRRAVLLPPDPAPGIAPWLFLNQLLPILYQPLAPSERRPLPVLPGVHGPLLVLSGNEGEWSTETTGYATRDLLTWTLPTPQATERKALWLAAGAPEPLSESLATAHRHTAGRIASLAATARQLALTQPQPQSQPDALTAAHIRAAARSGEGIGLATLAELIPDEVSSDALVLTPTLRAELESLLDRCRLRDTVHTSLGPAMQARYRSAVRALFTGPSGTGKTLAASWLATHLGMPLFRVDLSAITSKYIGETEKNLAQLLTRAEHSEVVLLFDEADSLFAKRTDVKDANDRFANSQTNYLLQRMESYDGITLLTSNSRARFDTAFARRLDVVLDFPPPGPQQRRDLWLAHLGEAHTLTPPQLNQLAASAELTGGQVRNVVLAAAIAAAARHSAIGWPHLLTGLAAEYRKLGRQLPPELSPQAPA